MKRMVFGGLGFVVAAGLVSGLLASAGGGEEFDLPAKNAAVEASALKAHVGFLASDELRGREAFTEDSAKAARYLKAALEHAGVPDVQFQAVPFERVSFSGPPELTLLDATGKRHALVYGAQFAVSSGVREGGVSPVEVQHVQAGELPTGEALASRAVIVHGSSREWREFRREHGDAGWGFLLHHQGERKERGAKDTPREQVSPAWQEQAAEPTLALKLYGDQTGWIDGVTTLEYDSKMKREAISEFNVVGTLPGVGLPDQPELKDEVIVVSAHYDHIGVNERAKPGEDAIRNGADDDASGVAALLEIAEAMAAGPAPARTVVFLLACAEEKGILGTRYFVHAPTVPLEQIVCNLNLEMLGRPDPLVGGAGKLWLSGYERSSLGPAFAKAGIDVVQDPRPEQSFFTRSDNIIFVQVGVVGQTLSSYNMHQDYHQVGDEIEGIDFAHLTLCTEAALQATLELSSGRLHPTWNDGEPKGVPQK